MHSDTQKVPNPKLKGQKKQKQNLNAGNSRILAGAVAP